jgi:small subunit ribosomal protein S11
MGEQKVKTIEAAQEAKAAAGIAASPKRKRKSREQVPRGRIYIQSTYNNVIISVTDLAGHLILWGTAGHLGFKGSRKSTPYAAQRTMEDVLKRLAERGMKEADVIVKGVGTGREAAVRAISGSGVSILSIRDRTPIPHGGVRPKKPRRV